MKHSKIESKDFKKKTWKNNNAKEIDDKSAFTIKELEKHEV